MVWSNRAACFLRLDKFEKALQDAQVGPLARLFACCTAWPA